MFFLIHSATCGKIAPGGTQIAVFEVSRVQFGENLFEAIDIGIVYVARPLEQFKYPAKSSGWSRR